MLQAKDVSFTYLGENISSLVNANIAFNNRTINQIVGNNGAGKTTLALALCGVIPYLINGIFNGIVTWKGELITKDNLSNFTSFVFQDPYSYFAGYTVREEKQFFETLPESLSQIADTLFPNVPLDVPLHKLSSGEQQRIAIVSAFSRPNPIIILDEPFEFLDTSARIQSSNLFMEKAKSESLIIVVERPRKNMIPIKYDSAFEVREGGIICSSSNMDFDLPHYIENSSKGSLNLHTEDLFFTYPDRRGFSINNLNLSIREGESIALTGPNGCGKTTLLLLLSGLIKPQKGNILIKSKRQDIKSLRQQVKCSFQNPNTQIFGGTVREDLEFGLLNARFNSQEIREKLDYAKSILPFDLDANPFSLSYGQKKLLGITATFLMQPRIILLDEPTASLDTNNLLKLYDLVHFFLEEGGSLLISTHDEDRISNLCSRVIEMAQGEIINERTNLA